MKENGSVIRILSILDLVSKNPDGLTLGQIYRELEMPKATAYDILQTLYRADAVYYKDPNLKNYVIGSRMYAIGSTYSKNSNLIEASSSILKEFSDKTGYTMQLAKKVEDKTIYIYKYEPTNVKIMTETDVGSIKYNRDKDISGRCFTVFDDKCEASTPEEKKINLSNGYITELSGSTSHIRNISIPIRNFENRVCGVVVASDLEVGDESYKTIIEDLKNSCSLISRSLGYIGDL
ncbi:MAG TPA: helix-turn-helix domain-containing protein [Haploplasma sp.]|nr:helix-turn-helix domain-containing protein [Haploplasma sp.]